MFHKGTIHLEHHRGNVNIKSTEIRDLKRNIRKKFVLIPKRNALLLYCYETQSTVMMSGVIYCDLSDPDLIEGEDRVEDMWLGVTVASQRQPGGRILVSNFSSAY